VTIETYRFYERLYERLLPAGGDRQPRCTRPRDLRHSLLAGLLQAQDGEVPFIRTDQARIRLFGWRPQRIARVCKTGIGWPVKPR
jgi:hypothetical protein